MEWRLSIVCSSRKKGSLFLCGRWFFSVLLQVGWLNATSEDRLPYRIRTGVDYLTSCTYFAETCIAIIKPTVLGIFYVLFLAATARFAIREVLRSIVISSIQILSLLPLVCHQTILFQTLRDKIQIMMPISTWIQIQSMVIVVLHLLH